MSGGHLKSVGKILSEFLIERIDLSVNTGIRIFVSGGQLMNVGKILSEFLIERTDLM